jgi:hypothetical protein
VGSQRPTAELRHGLKWRVYWRVKEFKEGMMEWWTNLWLKGGKDRCLDDCTNQFIGALLYRHAQLYAGELEVLEILWLLHWKKPDCRYTELTNFFRQMRLQLYLVLQMFYSFSHSLFVQTKLTPYSLQYLFTRRFYQFWRHFISGDKQVSYG